jgi:hypothetical protein
MLRHLPIPSRVSSLITGHDSMPPRLILGSGRSGTTWVLDCLAEANNLRPIFEPLHPAESALGLRYAHEVATIDDKDEVLARHFRDLIAGRIHSRWIDYRGARRVLFPSPSKFTSFSATKSWIRSWRKYLDNRITLRASAQRQDVLVKCIRANLMASWLTRTMGFRAALIVRHPCAVVESRYRLRWNPSVVLTRYHGNRRLHELTGGRYWDLLNSELTFVQALTLTWIIENQWPVEHSQEGGYSVVFYEDLVSNPSTSWRILCDSLDLPKPPDITSLRRPSQQASGRPADTTPSKWPEPRWQSRLTGEQLDSIQEILDATNCTLYSVERTAPSSILQQQHNDTLLTTN